MEFIAHEDFDLLREGELHEFTPARHAPMRLLEYLDRTMDTEPVLDPSYVRGTYHARKVSDGIQLDKALTLQRPLDDGCIQVVETVEKINLDDNSSLARRRESIDKRVNYFGWAIVTPEDNIMIYLKKEFNGRNLYYLTLYVDIHGWDDRELHTMFLLEHEFPAELADLRDINVHEITKSELVEEVKNNMWEYRKE